MRPRQYSDDDFKRAAAKHQTAEEVASEVGCSVVTATRRLRQLKISGSRGRPSQYDDAEAKRWALEYNGPSLAKFASAHKVSPSIMNRAIFRGISLLWSTTDPDSTVLNTPKPRTLRQLAIANTLRQIGVLVASPDIADKVGVPHVTTDEIRTYLREPVSRRRKRRLKSKFRPPQGPSTPPGGSS